jgi:hypothetical protein
MPAKKKTAATRKAKLKLKAIQKIEEEGKPITRMVIDTEDAPHLEIEKIDEPIELQHPDEPIQATDPATVEVLTFWQKLFGK